ncbi:hypothetical protein V6N11_031135 [Hibiscus sabdariffa]|uniref:Uncharacterized protein n=2 Tax=Hibiscus sabdariffa TaxID=183260 RepID=A0ABR2EG55_9ROSI
MTVRSLEIILDADNHPRSYSRTSMNLHHPRMELLWYLSVVDTIEWNLVPSVKLANEALAPRCHVLAKVNPESCHLPSEFMRSSSLLLDQDLLLG